MITQSPLAPPATPRRRGRRMLLGALALAVVLLGAGGAYVLWASSGSGEGEPVALVVPKGASASQIAGLLADEGVIRSPSLFRLVVRLRGSAGDLRAGKYELRTGMSYGDALALLRKGPKVVFTRITIPEGLTLGEIAAIVGKGTHIGASEFLAAARSGRHRARIGGQETTRLEGFLFPKTYDVLEDATADGVVRLMLDQFAKETAGLDLSRLAGLGVTPLQAVTIASMIEREAQVPHDRRPISGVIYNRIRRGMRLQIDATVQYAIFLETGSYKSRLLYRDLEIESPYNTYRIDGVPPGPIAAPGLASLRAAVNPADVPYIYYVLINDKGEHAFASTAAEFERLKAQARRNR